MKYEIEKLKEIKKSLCDVDITSESIIEDLNNKISELIIDIAKRIEVIILHFVRFFHTRKY